MDNKEEKYRVPSLEKGLSILDCLSRNNKGMTLQEIKEELELSQTTAYRIMNTMVRLEFLTYDERSRCYKLSLKLLTLGFRALNEHQLIETVLPHLQTLRDQVRETVCFGVMGEEKGVFINQAQGSYPFSFTLAPGKSFELHCSAPGKAIMAYLPNSVREKYLSNMDFQRFNERTITSREDYMKELRKILRLGYAIDNEEELTGVICIAAPVFDYRGYPCGSIWISGPKGRLTKEVIENNAVLIKEEAKLISAELGYMQTKK